MRKMKQTLLSCVSSSCGRLRRCTRPPPSAWKGTLTFSLMMKKSSCQPQTTATDCRWAAGKTKERDWMHEWIKGTGLVEAGMSDFFEREFTCRQALLCNDGAKSGSNKEQCVCVSGTWWQDGIGAVPVRGEVLQDPVYMYVQAGLCCGPGPGRRHCTGRNTQYTYSTCVHVKNSSKNEFS